MLNKTFLFIMMLFVALFSITGMIKLDTVVISGFLALIFNALYEIIDEIRRK